MRLLPLCGMAYEAARPGWLVAAGALVGAWLPGWASACELGAEGALPLPAGCACACRWAAACAWACARARAAAAAAACCACARSAGVADRL